MPQHLLITPLNSQTEPLRLVVPTSWADVTLDTYLRLHAGDNTAMLSVLTGLDAATIDQLAADDVGYLANCLAFAADLSPLLELLPTPGLPEVGASPYGLLVLATQYVEELPEGTPGIEAAPYLYALYRCQQVWGKVDDAKIEAIRAAVLAEPVTKVYADVAFFLSSYRRATSVTRPTPTTTPSPKKRSWRQALKALVSGSGPSSPSTRPPRRSA